MKKLMISLAAMTAIGAAVPAAAQSYGYNGGYGQNGGYDRYQGSYDRGYSSGYGVGGQLNNREQRIQAQMRAAEARGLLSYNEVLRLRQEMGQIERLEKHYRWNGLNPREGSEINARLNRVEARLAMLANDGRRYGYNDQRWNGRW